jgi:anti-sigma regulatory factor (Ser/Thr protein kinase)
MAARKLGRRFPNGGESAARLVGRTDGVSSGSRVGGGVKDGSPQHLRPDSRSGLPEPLDMTFRAADLPLARRRTASWALQAGMAADVADDFVIAVNEIATNAVRHGSPEASLRLRVNGRACLAEIRDQGHWPAASGNLPKRPAEDGGMGLEVAGMVCDDMQIEATRSGTCVRLRMKLR